MAEKFKKNKFDKKSPAKKSGRRTAIQATFFAITVVLLILVLMIVEFRPVKSVSAWSPSEALAMTTISAKLFNATKQRKSKLCRITFTASEVNTLLNMLLRTYDNEKKPADPTIYAVWRSGFSDTACSIKFAGVYLNFYLKITPSYSNGKPYLQIRSCRLGKLPLPSGILEKAANDELQRSISKDRKVQYALQLLHSLQTEKSGEINIEFLRKNSGKMIRSFL